MSPRTPLKSPKTGQALLDQYYLQIRSALVEAAAGLDRIQRADEDGTAMQDIRVRRLKEIARIITEDREGRTERALNSLSTGPAK